ncbi:uncharacterized protein K02A2.6-like [Octopus sinensis]|uniref:Uncharacterized protein K02A2.6-like n=1 Tax=Octopus sinensis TaxID=2607531 RepID=A0A6P7SFW7_9MOLL|nr:uncharacterized protein K02A2.6-like [Octopus sinensis]
MKVKFPPEKYPEHIKGIIIDNERYSKLKELFGGNIDPLGVVIVFDDLHQPDPSRADTINIPYAIVSDNRTQFMSDELRRYCKLFIIVHVTTPPYHPKSNGQAERFVDTFKRALQKANSEVMDNIALQEFLRAYQVTSSPNTPSGVSHAELSFARNVIRF